jgi:hypothetical protein
MKFLNALFHVIWGKHSCSIYMQHTITASLTIISAIKSRRMRWVEHVECMEAIRNAYKIFVGKPEGMKPLRMDVRVILQWILGKYDWRLWTGSIWMRTGTSGGLL